MLNSAITFSTLVPILVAFIPAIGGIIVGLAQRQAVSPRPYRNLGHVVDMLAKAPDGVGKQALDDLVRVQADRLKNSTSNVRKANPTNVALSIVLAGFAAFLMYWLTQWIVIAHGTGWVVIAWVVTIVVGFCLTAFVAASIGTIYSPATTKEEREAKRVVKAAARDAKNTAKAAARLPK